MKSLVFVAISIFCTTVYADDIFLTVSSDVSGGLSDIRSENVPTDTGTDNLQLGLNDSALVLIWSDVNLAVNTFDPSVSGFGYFGGLNTSVPTVVGLGIFGVLNPIADGVNRRFDMASGGSLVTLITTDINSPSVGVGPSTASTDPFFSVTEDAFLLGYIDVTATDVGQVDLEPSLGVFGLGLPDSITNSGVSITVVPEPGSCVGFGIYCFAMLLNRRHRQVKSSIR